MIAKGQLLMADSFFGCGSAALGWHDMGMDMSLNADEVRTLISGAALVLSMVSLGFTFRMQRTLKQADILAGFHHRFDDLQRDRSALLVRETLPDTRTDYLAKIFFDRFWSLQFDQYVAWQQRYVPDDVYRFWVFARWQQLHQPTQDWNINGLTVRSTFEEADKTWAKEPERGLGRKPFVVGFLGMYGELKDAKEVRTVEQIISRYAPILSELNYPG